MSNVSGNFLLAVFNLDGGPLMVAGRAAIIGGDTVYPAVLSWGEVTGKSASLTVSSLGLPADLGFWVRRGATVYDMPEEASSLAEGAVKFDGIVQDEPTEQGAVLSIALCEPRLKVRKVPSGAPISADVWPLATDEAMGKVPPEVFGTVEECPLLPVQLPPYSTLANDVEPGQTSLPIADSSKFPNAGTVAVDGVRYAYSSKTDNALLGVSATAFHRSGTAVSVVGEAIYLAAGHAVSDVSSVRADGSFIGGGTVDLAAGLVRFSGIPTTEQTGSEQELLAQFDQVDGTSTAINGFNSIRAAAVPGAGETNPQTQSAATGGSFSIALDIPVTYTVGTPASGSVQEVYQPLAMSYALPNGVIAGTYQFVVTFEDKTDPAMSHQTTVTVGGVAQTLYGTKPQMLVFSVPLAAGQSTLTIAHSQTGGAWPLDRVSPVMDVTIKSVSGTVLASDGRPTGVTGSSEIVFPHPSKVAGTDKIIAGAYQVTYSVAVDPAVVLAGVAQVKIGGQVVWVWDSGVVVYEQNPAIVSQDDNTDRLPVSIECPTAQAGAFSLSISAATRTVVIGNVDNSVYATLRKGGNTVLAVNQTTDMASRGKIKSAKLFVEFWSKAQTIDAVDVYFDGAKLGQLSFATDAATAATTITKTIAVDTVSSVGAALQNPSAIGNMVSQAANYSSNVSVSTITTPIAYVQSGATSGAWFGCNKPLSQKLPLPPGTTAQTITFSVTFGSAGSPSSTGNSQVNLGGNYITPNFDTTVSVNVTVSAGQTFVLLTHQHIFGTSYGLPGAEPMINYVTYNVQVNPQFAISGGGFSGTPQVANGGAVNVNPFTPVAKVSGVAGSGNLSFDIPGDATPRAAINVFDLPMAAVLGWRYFTGKKVKLVYAGADTTHDVNISLVQLVIDYAPVANVPATSLTATITGRSGNPADVLRYLAEAAGETVAPQAWRRLWKWADAVGFTFGRRLSEADDASTLLAEAAQAALVQIAATEDGKAFVRRVDEGSVCHTVTRADLMQEPEIEWASPNDSGDVAGSGGVWNELVLRYRRIGESTRALTRNATSDRWAHRSERQLGERQSLEVDTYSSWIADDATAALFASDWLRLNAPMRRRLTLALPFTFADVQEGDLIEYEPLGIPARVLTKKTDGAGFVTVTAEELPLP